MSRRRRLWRDKLGYNSATKGMSDARAKGYHTSQCGGDSVKLEATRPVTARDSKGNICTRPMRRPMFGPRSVGAPAVEVSPQ